MKEKNYISTNTSFCKLNIATLNILFHIPLGNVICEGADYNTCRNPAKYFFFFFFFYTNNCLCLITDRTQSIGAVTLLGLPMGFICAKPINYKVETGEILHQDLEGERCSVSTSVTYTWVTLFLYIVNSK